MPKISRAADIRHADKESHVDYFDRHAPNVICETKARKGKKFHVKVRIGDAFTHPDYKLKNILRAASSRIALDCHYRHGKQKIMACVDSQKWPLYQKLYKITGLGKVHPAVEIRRTRFMGIWRCTMRRL